MLSVVRRARVPVPRRTHVRRFALCNGWPLPQVSGVMMTYGAVEQDLDQNYNRDGVWESQQFYRWEGRWEVEGVHICVCGVGSGGVGGAQPGDRGRGTSCQSKARDPLMATA